MTPAGHLDAQLKQMADHVAERDRRIAELEAVLREIANGKISEGGTRLNHPNATTIARIALGMEG